MAISRIILAIIGTFLLAISYQALAAYLTSPEGLKYPNPGHYPGEIGPGTFNCSNNTNCYWKFPKALFIDSDKGRVGIGNENPKEELDVVGDIHASGDICSDVGGGICLGDSCRYCLKLPKLIGSYEISGARSLDISGNYAYIISKSSLGIINISNPYYPSLTGNISEGGYDVFVSGNYAYVSFTSGTNKYLSVIDVSNPSSPSLKGKTFLVGGKNVVVSGNYAFLQDGFNLWVANVSDPTNPTRVALKGLPSPPEGMDLYISGNYLYIATSCEEWTFCSSPGLLIYNISDPINPTLIGRYVTTDSYGVHVSGNYAFLVGESGLQILNVSDPSNPVLVKTFATPTCAKVIHVSDNYAYVVDRSFKLLIIDVSNVSNPIFVGKYEVLNDPKDVYAKGDYIYVIDANGLKILDPNFRVPSLYAGDAEIRNLKVYGDGEIEGDLEVGRGVVVGNPAGGNMGKGKINAEGIYVNGSKVWGECISIPKSCSCNPLAGGCPCNPGAAGCPAGYSLVYVSSPVYTGKVGADEYYLSTTVCCK